MCLCVVCVVSGTVGCSRDRSRFVLKALLLCVCVLCVLYVGLWVVAGTGVGLC